VPNAEIAPPPGLQIHRRGRAWRPVEAQMRLLARTGGLIGHAHPPDLPSLEGSDATTARQGRIDQRRAGLDRSRRAHVLAMPSQRDAARRVMQLPLRVPDVTDSRVGYDSTGMVVHMRSPSSLMVGWALPRRGGSSESDSTSYVDRVAEFGNRPSRDPGQDTFVSHSLLGERAAESLDV